MRLLILMFGLLAAAAPFAQPQITEEVPYVRTPQEVVDAMLELAGVRASDFLIDLGSGDGRTVITAAKRYGARGFGVDLDRRLVAESADRARAAGVADRVAFYEQDIFKTDLDSASVITMYLLPEYNLALRPRLLALKPGTRIVSHDWDMADWKHDASVEVDAPDKPVGLRKSSTVHLWIVPARVEGKWRSSLSPGGRGAHFDLRQNFQELSGTLSIGGRSLPLERAVLKGTFLSFRVQEGKRTLRFNGHAAAGRISGQLGIGEHTYRWRALRAD